VCWVKALRGLSPCRLKHIIEQYADGPGVLLELVQNADDAGASEISFLLDTQTYASNSVLGKHHRGMRIYIATYIKWLRVPPGNVAGFEMLAGNQGKSGADGGDRRYMTHVHPSISACYGSRSGI